MTKTIKITGDLKYMDSIVTSMLAKLDRKDGINMGHAKNHHTVLFTYNTGETITAHAYETKTMTIIEWY